MKFATLVALPSALVVAQTPPPDLSPLAYYGVAGILLAFILWLYMDERKEHRKLRDKVLSDVLPAIISNNEQMKETAAALLLIQQLPKIDPVAFADWVRTMRDVRDRLDAEWRRRD